MTEKITRKHGLENAFTLAEMAMVMLVLCLVLAILAPVITNASRKFFVKGDVDDSTNQTVKVLVSCYYDNNTKTYAYLTSGTDSGNNNLTSAQINALITPGITTSGC